MIYTGSYSTITDEEVENFKKHLHAERLVLEGKSFPCNLCNFYALVTTEYRGNRKSDKKHFCTKFNKELSSLDGCESFLYTFPGQNRVFSIKDLKKHAKK